MAKLTEEQREEIVRAYLVDLIPMIDLGRSYGVTRQSIRNVVMAAGHRPRHCTWVERRCHHCNKKIRVRRYRARATRHSYCGSSCYYAKLHRPDYRASSQASRIARATVRRWYPLWDHQIVHHVDGNPHNNELENLMVFDSHADHMRWHRLWGEPSGVIPVWRGDVVTGLIPWSVEAARAAEPSRVAKKRPRRPKP